MRTPQAMLRCTVKDAYRTRSHTTSTWEVLALLLPPPTTNSLVVLEETTAMWHVKSPKFTALVWRTSRQPLGKERRSFFFWDTHEENGCCLWLPV